MQVPARLKEKYSWCLNLKLKDNGHIWKKEDPLEAPKAVNLHKKISNNLSEF